jgi:hypothetical protein
MTCIRCLALLHCYYHFKKVRLLLPHFFDYSEIAAGKVLLINALSN